MSESTTEVLRRAAAAAVAAALPGEFDSRPLLCHHPKHPKSDPASHWPRRDRRPSPERRFTETLRDTRTRAISYRNDRRGPAARSSKQRRHHRHSPPHSPHGAVVPSPERRPSRLAEAPDRAGDDVENDPKTQPQPHQHIGTPTRSEVRPWRRELHRIRDSDPAWHEGRSRRRDINRNLGAVCRRFMMRRLQCQMAGRNRVIIRTNGVGRQISNALPMTGVWLNEP